MEQARKTDRLVRGLWRMGSSTELPALPSTNNCVKCNRGRRLCSMGFKIQDESRTHSQQDSFLELPSCCAMNRPWAACTRVRRHCWLLCLEFLSPLSLSFLLLHHQLKSHLLQATFHKFSETGLKVPFICFYSIIYIPQEEHFPRCVMNRNHLLNTYYVPITVKYFTHKYLFSSLWSSQVLLSPFYR